MYSYVKSRVETKNFSARSARSIVLNPILEMVALPVIAIDI